MWRVQLFELNYDHQEAEAVKSVVDGGWLTMGEQTVGFESAFESFLGSGRCTAVSSCTAALHMSMLALDVGPGDEVLVPALTFIAAVNAVRMVGATPILVDCESHDVWNCSIDDIAARITPRTKAVTCVHYGGYPCRMDRLVALCRERGVPLVEDVAHAPGAAFNGRALGTWGDVGCFSFFSNKNLSVGEGGMLVTSDEELHRRLRYLRSHGMTTLTMDRHEGRAVTYDVVGPGLNYRIDEMRAALGMIQLEKLGAANRERRRLVERYHQRMDEIDGVAAPFRDYHADESAFHIYPLLVDEGIDRDAVVKALRSRGVQASIHYPSIAAFSGYSSLDMGACPIADDISRREVTLPLFPTMGDDKVDIVCQALAESLAEAVAHG